MIPLRLKATLDGDRHDAFVVRLTRDEETHQAPATSADLLDSHCATLVTEFPSELIFQTSYGPLRVYNATISDIDGDVLFVTPRRQLAHRWVRKASKHNTLVITEMCDQLCTMCSQPPKKYHQDLFQYFKVAVNLAPAESQIGISGGEPTLYKAQLFDLIEHAHSQRPDLSFHVLTNGQHFTAEDNSFLRSRACQNVCWGVPIYSARPEEHDEIVGKVGAFAKLFDSLAVLMRSSANVELRTVIMKLNEPLLPDLARLIGIHLGFASIWALMQLENIGFARMRWDELFFDHSAKFGRIADAVDIAMSRGVNVQLYNFPRCTVPKAYRDLASPTISDWKQRFLGACESCSATEQCSGFFEWYPDDRGFKGVHPI